MIDVHLSSFAYNRLKSCRWITYPQSTCKRLWALKSVNNIMYLFIHAQVIIYPCRLLHISPAPCIPINPYAGYYISTCIPIYSCKLLYIHVCRCRLLYIHVCVSGYCPAPCCFPAPCYCPALHVSRETFPSISLHTYLSMQVIIIHARVII